MNHSKALFTFCAITFCAVQAHSQSRISTPADTIKLYRGPEVVVTATRVQTPYDEVASTITVLTSEELQHKQIQTVAQALQYAGGLAVASSGGTGKATSVFLRGANSDHTLVMIDGVELNDPSAPGNAYDFGALMVSGIERIEILHGPQSTLFGSNAIGGVINILTKSNTGPAEISASAEAGGYETAKINAGISGGSENLHYAAHANRLTTGGYSISGPAGGTSESDGYENTTIALKLGGKANKTIDFDFNVHYIEAQGDLDHGGVAGDDPNYTFDSKQLTVKSALQLSHLQSRWQHSLSLAYTNHVRDANDLFDEMRPMDASSNHTEGQRVKLDWQNNLYFIPGAIVTFGIESENETAVSSFRSQSSFGPFDSRFPQTSVRTTGFYLQNQLSPLKNLSANLGIRLDRHDEFGEHLTYRLGVSWHFSEIGMRLKGTLGSGFNAPTLFEIYDPAFGNPDLQPEKSLGWDAGVEQTLLDRKLQFSVTYFSNSFDDLIGFDENFRSINIDAAKSRGVEMSLIAHPAKRVSLRANYAFIETEDRTPKSADFGKALLRRPEHRATLSVHMQPFSRASIDIGMQYSGMRDDLDFEAFPAARMALGAYLLVDVAASYRLAENISVLARVENLLDQAYQEVLYYNTAGRAAYLGLRSTF